jgi:hypothetical protein
VEILVGPPRRQIRGASTLRAAIYLGATASNDPQVVVASLVGLLALNSGPRYRPTATVTRALSSHV